MLYLEYKLANDEEQDNTQGIGTKGVPNKMEQLRKANEKAQEMEELK